MDKFIPEKVFYEPKALEHPQGKQLLDKYKHKGIECSEIMGHHNIQEHRQMSDDQFVNMKKYLIIGTRKTQKFVPNEKISDYLVPYTSSGCPAICTYCYLVCNFFKCSYLRVFVNREKLLDRLIKKSIEEGNKVYEIGSNSDLIIEDTVTNNLPWTITNFAKRGKGKITFPTKFGMVDKLLPLDHKEKCIVRMSLNPEMFVRKAELLTSSLDDRISAIKKLYEAGYPIGILIAPVIIIDDYLNLYEELFIRLADELPQKLKEELGLEIIFMTYSQAHITINSASLPNAFNVFNKEIMKYGYRGKYRYKKDVLIKAQSHIEHLLRRHLPESNIVYIC